MTPQDDRFIFGLAYQNEKQRDDWSRILQKAALEKRRQKEANENERPRVSFGRKYQEALEMSLRMTKLSFSLKPKSRQLDDSKAKLLEYSENRRDEINTEPASVLDAPGLRDDYYLNILEWSQKNQLAVALNESVYVWDPTNGSVQLLSQVDANYDYISSLVYSADGNTLNMANSQGCLSTFDVVCGRRVKDFYIRDTGRIAAMAMCPSGSEIHDDCLTLGTKLGNIYHFDPRDPAQIPAVVMQEHVLEVCGLKRSFDGYQVASGGNDNKVCIWDLRWPAEVVWRQTDHLAAVKALDWCPWHRNLLVTGAGTADRRIRFWNTMSNACLREIQCESQVCGLRWSRDHAELVSSHGFSNHELALWHYPSLTKITEIRAHESRVLQMAMSPDGKTVVTAAANEHLKFWNLFP